MTDHVKETEQIDISGKSDQIADLVRHAVRKAVTDGLLDPKLLQNIIENGGVLQAAMLPVLTKVVGILVDSALLEPVSFVQVAGVEAFDAKTKFIAATTTDGVKVGYLSEDFNANFLNKIEIDVSPQRIRIHKPRKESVDQPIIEELGGGELIETNLATMWELLKKQGQGQSGELLTNGNANIFYIRDGNDTLWAVYCRWHEGRWNVYLGSVAGPYGWIADDQVCSR